MKDNTKVILLDIIIISIGVILFSNKFMGIDINSEDATIKGISETIIFFSIVVLIYINGVFIYEHNFKNKHISNEPVNRTNESISKKETKIYIRKLKANRNNNLCKENIKYIIGQINRMSKKVEKLKEIIDVRFHKGDITYIKINDNIKEIDSIFYFNIAQIIHKLEAFDEDEFLKGLNNDVDRINKRLEDKRNKIYQSYKSDIEKGILDNEEILIKLDELIIEFSRLITEETTSGKRGVSRAIQKVNELIEIGKYYK